MEEFVEPLCKLLECFCCLELPKPGTTTVGICSNGHMTCQDCGLRILKNKDFGACPMCRENTFRVRPGHKLAVSIIQILTNNLLYNCEHPNCNQQITGDHLVIHQKRCPFKPILCPKTECFEKEPLANYFSGQHPCVRVAYLDEATQMWDVTVAITDIYSFDANEIYIPDTFKPILLKGITNIGYISSAYINIVHKHGKAAFFAGWLNLKDDVEEQYKTIQIDTHVYVNTANGQVGQFISRSPKYQYETDPFVEYSIALTRHTLFRWAEWSQCKTCNTILPHVHISVSLKPTPTVQL